MVGLSAITVRTASAMTTNTADILFTWVPKSWLDDYIKMGWQIEVEWEMWAACGHYTGLTSVLMKKETEAR